MQLFPTSSQLRGRNLPLAFGSVAVGGAVGATARWMVGTQSSLQPATWPWATLIVNLIGCALIGVAAHLVERGSLRWDFAVTGLLGGFTTMSSFAVELNDMVDAGRSAVALAYGATTLLCGAATLVLASGVAQRALPSAAELPS